MTVWYHVFMEKTSAPDKQIEVITRAVIVRDRQILLCRAKDADWFFLPGGHVEFSEKLETALSREIGEELGLRAAIGPRIGVVENIYRKKNVRYHEINFIFSVKIPKNSRIMSRENHIEFVWQEIESIKNVRLLPVSLRKIIFAGRSG